MSRLNEKEELIYFLSGSLPTLSDHINQIVISMPKDLEDLESKHIINIKPKVKAMLKFTKENLRQIKPIDTIHADDEVKEIYDIYFSAITDILEGVERLYSFLLNEKGSSEEYLVIFIEKLYEGSVGIMKLVDKVTK